MGRSSIRQLQAERMDQPGLPAAEHRHALRSLARINWISRSASIVGGPIFAAAEAHSASRPLRVLDLACGGGDVLIQLATRSGTRKIEWLGCDQSETALEHARDQARAAGVAIDLARCDVLQDDFAEEVDVVMCSLFLHHLTEEQAVHLLTRMRSAARTMVLVNDLIRSRWGYWLAWIGCRLLTRSPVVHFDGPVSVGGAYTVDEARGLAERAGLNGATFRRCWPQRFLLEWRRPSC